MQTLFFMALFSLVFSLMAGIISNGTSNSAQLSELHIAETKDYFDKVSKVVLNDITVEYLHGNPNNATTIADYISNLPQLKMLSSGRYADPSVDAWGHPISGQIVTEYQSLSSSADANNKVVVPVTGILFVSKGPDGILQTTIPTATTIAQLYTVVPTTDANGKPLNDDIIYAFDNRTSQQTIFEAMKSGMNRIGIAARKELESSMSTYRQSRALLYNQQIASGQEGDPALLDLTNDANAPRFLCLDTTVTKGGCTTGVTGRNKLGVQSEFDTIERTLTSGGHFVLTAPQPATNSDPLVITVQNDTTKPTPWGKPANTFKFQVTIKNTSS